MKRRLPLGWICAGLLFGLYLGLKLQGWWFSTQVWRLERELDRLRPALSSIVLTEQLQRSHQALTQVLDQIRQMDIQGSALLEQLSQEVPASVTLRKLEVHPPMGIRIHGTFLPGIRNPESALGVWVQRLQEKGLKVKLRVVSPSREDPSAWDFELKQEGS